MKSRGEILKRSKKNSVAPIKHATKARKAKISKPTRKRPVDQPQIRLGVNIDHVATLRQVRGGTTSYPDLLAAADSARLGGADQITIHLREDRRHIQDQDVVDICAWAKRLPADKRVLVNLELALNPEILSLAKKLRPDWCCFVPEKRQELTTEGGLDAKSVASDLERAIQELQKVGVKSSLFLAPDLEQVSVAQKLGAEAIEFHTGAWVHLKGAERKKEWARLLQAAELTHSLGMGVHAGHGLDFNSTSELLGLPHLQEVNIGHFLICESVFTGLQSAVSRMKKVLRQ